MAKSNSFRTDQHAEWDWGDGTAHGQVKDRFQRQATRTLKDGEITRDGSEDNPAYSIRQDDGDEVLKLGSELRAAN